MTYLTLLTEIDDGWKFLKTLEREMSRRIHLQFDEWKALKNQSIFSLRPSSPLSNCTSEKV